MVDPHWTSYVGMITGISGAIMGFISYRRSNNLKSLDLRLDLRKSANNLREEHDQATNLIIKANNSRRAVAAATENLGSGRMKLWEEAIETDTERINRLKEEMPDSDETYSSMKAEELESKLVEIHSIQCSVDSIISKYRAEVESDDETRRHISDTHGG